MSQIDADDEGEFASGEVLSFAASRREILFSAASFCDICGSLLVTLENGVNGVGRQAHE
jgi:hypothetical protein